MRKKSSVNDDIFSWTFLKKIEFFAISWVQVSQIKEEFVFVLY